MNYQHSTWGLNLPSPSINLIPPLPTITKWKKGHVCGLAEANANVSLTFELRKKKNNPNCGI